MDKRSLLLGLGIGLIAGALLMQLFLIGEQSTRELEDREGIIQNSPATIPESSQEEQSEILNELNEKVEQEVDKQYEENLEEAEQLPSNSSSNIDNNEGDLLDTEQAPSTLLLYIVGGSTVSQISAVLYDNGIIEDNQAFIDYTRDKKKNIRAGYFLVKPNMTNEQILTVLTTKPLEEKEALVLKENQTYPFIVSPQ